MTDKPMPNLFFRVMTQAMKIRNLSMPPADMLAEVEIKPGFKVLDFGCGPACFVPLLADAVGEDGEVYALDIQPLAKQAVEKLAARKRLTNVSGICSDCATGLPDGCLDMVLFYDVFHQLDEPGRVLAEIHRILKPDGVLSFSDHHLKDDAIVAGVNEGGLFRLRYRGDLTYEFQKQVSAG
jgi:ubiquinone/menaquinone biosynthesis C-methylase UbiE